MAGFRCTKVLVDKGLGVHLFQCTVVPVYRGSSVQRFQCTKVFASAGAVKAAATPVQ